MQTVSSNLALLSTRNVELQLWCQLGTQQNVSSATTAHSSAHMLPFVRSCFLLMKLLKHQRISSLRTQSRSQASTSILWLSLHSTAWDAVSVLPFVLRKQFLWLNARKKTTCSRYSTTSLQTSARRQTLESTNLLQKDHSSTSRCLSSQALAQDVQKHLTAA